VKICPVCSTEYPDDVRFCQNDGQTLRASSPAHDLVGQVVADRYHVVRKLGEGGMGQVYLAEHVKMGRKSAIKVMNPAMVHDPDAVARFNREAANASRITHPNVCAIYDFGETPEGLIYLAMEFVEGEPLTDVLERERALPAPRAAAIFLQVADALQAAHDLGIVHRDLKPDNIMLARARDGSDVVKVVDFGIAKAVAGDDSQKVTKTGLVVGTPEFMSPEQLSGDKLDGRSDLYALALVLFKMLTGKLPFAGGTVQETMVKRLIDDPATLAAVRPDLAFPPGLQATLDAALTRSPADRYRSTTKFARDVAAVLGVERGGGGRLPPTRPDADGKTELLRRPSPSPATPPAGPKRLRVPLIASAVVVLGGAGAAVTMILGRARTTDAAARLHSTTQGAPPAGTDTARRRRAPPAPPSVAGRPTALDSSAIDSALGRLVDLVVIPATAEKGRLRAQRYYEDPGVPTRLRAQAAFTVAQAYFIELRKDDACRWNGRALELAPGNETYLKFQHEGCP
jgi:eukaryotic-like serine/threonine-protein kinase